MLTPELHNLQMILRRGEIPRNLSRDQWKRILNELTILDSINPDSDENLNESMSLSSGVCPTCGRKL